MDDFHDAEGFSPPLDSHPLKPMRPYLNPTLSVNFENLKGCGLLSDAENALLLDAFSRRESEVSRTAYTQILQSHNEISLDDWGVRASSQTPIAALTASTALANDPKQAKSAEAGAFRPVRNGNDEHSSPQPHPAIVSEPPLRDGTGHISPIYRKVTNEFVPLQELSSKPEISSSGGFTLPPVTAQLGDLTQLIETAAANTTAIKGALHKHRPSDFVIVHSPPGLLLSQEPQGSHHASLPISPDDNFRQDITSYYSGGPYGAPREGSPSSARSTTPSSLPIAYQPYPRPATTRPVNSRMTFDGIIHPQTGGFKCPFPECNTQPFQTQYLLNLHANIHSSSHLYYCPLKGCPRGVGGKGFKLRMDMIRHHAAHQSLDYHCPYCQGGKRKYSRPEYLRRHVRIQHADKDIDDPLLEEALSRRGRRRGGETQYGSAMRITANYQRDKHSQINITNSGLNLDPSKALGGEMSEQLSHLHAEARAAESEQILPTQLIDLATMDYTEINEDHPMLRQETKGVDSTHVNERIVGPRQVEQHLIGAINDVPFTDSGYSSLRNNLCHHSNIPFSPDRPQCTTSTEQSTSTNDVDRDGAKTLYSAATTVDPSHAQHYITDLCADIYGKFRQCSDLKFWSTMSRALSMLIKAFAIKIGHESSAQVNQEIMYFLHRRHDQIFIQLKAMFLCEDDAIPDISQIERNGMSLNDKMSMWKSKSGEDQSVIETDDLYQGVKDYEDDIIDRVDLPTYHKIIIDSAAYEWFLASLKTEINLQWSATQPRAMVESIRQRILDKLPTGTISKRRAISGHEVKFDIQWGLEHENFDQLMPSNLLLAEYITVTGSAEEAQALTVKQYLSQTWPTSGPRLLNVLQNTINSHHHHYSVILLDNTQFEARICDSRLSMTVTGPAHFIAECGEQLAWLQIALFNNDQHYAKYCTPSITSYWVNPSLSEKLNYEGYCKIGLDIAHSATAGDSMLRVQNSWQDLVGLSTIIAGFPISRRPENYPGLELPFSTLLHLLKANKATTTDGSVLLKGQNKTVQLMKHSNNVFLWHPLHSKDQSCSCCTNRHVGVNSVAYHSPLDLRILTAGRHILSDCIDLQTAVGMKTNIDHSFQMPGSPKAVYDPSCVLAKTNPLDSLCLDYNQPTIGHDESPLMLSKCQNDTAILTPSITGIGDHSVLTDRLPSFQKNNLEINTKLGDVNPFTADFHFLIATGSSNDSLESDFLSLSDSSEQIEPINSSEPAYLLLNNLMQELLSSFRSTTQRQPSPGENGERSVTESTTTTSSNTTGNLAQCRRSKRKFEDDDEIGEDGFRKPPRKRINPGQGKGLQRTLACPYLKLDPLAHRECCKYQLTRIRDVKQHLYRQHTPEFYCQRCFKTDFLDQQSLQSHVNQGICPINEPTVLEGISNQQQKQLSRRSNSGLSEEDQWFAIWAILFPGLQRPLSAYMDTGFSEDIRLFREYCLARGPTVLREQIESDPAWSGADVNVEQRQIYLNRVIAQGINSLFEEYLLNIPSPDSTGDQRALSSRQLSHNLQSTRLANSTSSNGDSGVAMDSLFSREDLSDQITSSVEFNNQMATAGSRVQDIPTTQEFIAEPSQSHGQTMLDPALGHYFGGQLPLAEWPTFDLAADFDNLTNLDLRS